MELLSQGRERELAGRAGESPRAARWLLGRVWDTDETRRRHAARAVGWTAIERPELAVELARRFLWALNDESATNGVYAVAALGEMGKRAPELLAPFLAPLATRVEDEGLRPEILRAFLAVADTAPHLVRPHLPALERAVSETPDEQRSAYARLAALAAAEDS